MNCPNCGKSLRPGATFCSQCGQAVSAGAESAPPPIPAPIPSPQPGPAGPARPIPAAQPIGQLGASSTSSSLWGPFAGYGTRREHVAWLLEGLGGQAEQLRDAITDLFNRRQIPKAQVRQVILTGRGIAVEQRPFYRIQRGLATVWLYVARFGEDLYISQVSYVKGPISMLRVLVAALLATMVGIWFLDTIGVYLNLTVFFNSLGGGLFGGGPAAEPSGFLIWTLCCISPFGILALLALMIGLFYSCYKFVTEKDILALLRSPLNEFQEDDIVSLEKAVNETVRKSADLIGIDLKLLAPGQAYRSGRRLI